MADLNQKLNELYLKHTAYSQQQDLFNDRSQEFFNTGQNKLAVKYDSKAQAKAKQLKSLDKKIAILKEKINSSCKFVEIRLITLPRLLIESDTQFFVNQILGVSNEYKNKKYSVHGIVTKKIGTNEKLLVIVVNEGSLSQEKLTKEFKKSSLEFSEELWPYPQDEEDSDLEDESINEFEYAE